MRHRFRAGGGYEVEKGLHSYIFVSLGRPYLLNII